MKNIETLTPAQAILRLSGAGIPKSYNQVLRLVFLGHLHGWQDQNGRWRIAASDVDRLVEKHLATA